MGKTDDEIKILKEKVDELSKKIDSINYYLIQVMNQVKELSKKGTGGEAIGGNIAIDLGPLVERLDKIESNMITKGDLTEISQKIEVFASEDKKQAQEALARLTALFEQGLEIIKLENTLDDIKSLLEETVLKEE